MTIPVPFAYLDQLYTEIGLLFIISIALFVWNLCLLHILHKRKKGHLCLNTQLQQYEVQQHDYETKLQQYETQLHDYEALLQQYDSQLHDYETQILQYENQLQKNETRRQQYKLKQQQQEAAKNIVDQNILHTPSRFYTQKESCMTPNESRIFYYINIALDDLFPDKDERKLYFVFPQTCLYSFIKVKKLPDLLYDVARRNYIAKSVDYIICLDNNQPYPYGSYKEKGYTYHAYTPILLIELDGKSHYSAASYGPESLEHQQQSDSFKNALFDDLHIPLIRYKVETDFVKTDAAPIIKNMIKDKLNL